MEDGILWALAFCWPTFGRNLIGIPNGPFISAASAAAAFAAATAAAAAAAEDDDEDGGDDMGARGAAFCWTTRAERS